MKKPILILGTVLLGGLLSSSAMAGVAVGVRAGSFGYGADFDVGLTEKLNLRLGYNTFSYDRTFEDTDVTYDGTLKIGAASAIFDWHVFNGGFRLSAGAVQKGPKIDVIGKPTAGSYEFNGTTYTAAQIGNPTGTVTIGKSTAPYIGIGWGNTVDKDDRITFLLDIGAINTGSPDVDLNFTCSPIQTVAFSDDPTCSQFKARIATEEAELEDDVSDYEWYPVVSLGIAIRF